MATAVACDRRAPAPSIPPNVDSAATEAEFLTELRKYLLLLAILTATVTYSAGLNPPGGFWPDNGGSRTSARLVGDPVLRVIYPRRYKAFFYCNATAFIASLVIVNLLLVRSLCHRRHWLRALQAAMVLDQFGLMGAYAASSCREVAMSAYVLVLVALVASYVCVHLLLFWLLAVRARGGGNGTPEAPKSVERARKHLLTFATLAATITYQAGLSTPGGFWPGSQDGDADHHLLAGDPLLRVLHPDRFMVFFYSNTTAFVASLVLIMLLMSKTVTRHGFRSCALWVCAGAAIVGLMGAFASGSCRSVKTSIYVVALVATVLFYIGIQVLVFLCKPVENLSHHVQETLERYLEFDKLKQKIHQQQSIACALGNGNGDACQILKKSRMYLLLLGILAASVTYQAGLNPPGGFWRDAAPDARHHYLAGDPVLHISYPPRYLTFYYFNATAFIASLVILLLLLSNVFSTQGIKYCALQFAMILDLFGLIGAYAAGIWRRVSTSVYVSVLVVSVFLYVSIRVVVSMLEVLRSCAAWRDASREKMEQCDPGRFVLSAGEHAEEEVEEAPAMERELEKRRELLLLLAILAASLTYQAGMSPPGGFWQENNSGHVVGNPVLNDNYRRRYLVFFYCNATAFVASLAIIMLLVNRKLSARGIRSYALRVCVILDLIGLMGAFAAGSCRKTSMVDVLVLVFAVLLCIAFQVTLSISETVRCLVRRLLLKLGWPQLPLGADPFVEEGGSEDELHFGLAGGTNEEPLGGEISSSILGGALTLILAVPAVAILQTPVKLLVAMMIATIVVGIWRRLFAPSVKALARALQRRCLRNQDTSTFSNPREHLVSALCHGLCKLIHTLCSGPWMWITIKVIWVPSLKPNLKLKFKMSNISAVLGVLIVSTTASATGTRTCTTTAMDRPSTATAIGTSTTTTTTMDTPSTATSTLTSRTTPTITSGTSMGPRDQPLVEPRPVRSRRPNTRLMGGDWVN